MVRLVPEEPNFATQSEREVWQRLRDQLGDDDVLMAGVWATCKGSHGPQAGVRLLCKHRAPGTRQTREK